MTAMPLNFEELTKGLPTKSEKIRTLGRAGVPTGEIARFLGIRYQHARNVLADAGLCGRLRQPSAAPDQATPVETGTKVRGVWLKIAADGSICIPAQLMARAELKPGGQVHVRVNDDAIEFLSQKAALRRAHEIVSRYVPPGVSLVDELIAERRAEAQRELDGKR